MSKGSSYWSTARGKIGNTVVAINKGQRIERAYQPVVSNPKSDKQMIQRAIFACQVKFFRKGAKNLFKFAFENKKQTESDYNAFMRNNRGVGMIVTREQYLNEYYPAIGNKFMLTQGSLSEIVVNDDVDDLSIYAKTNGTVTGDVASMTVAQLTSVLESLYGDYEDGDILTVVRVKSSLEDITDEPSSQPAWNIYQLVLNSENTALVKDKGFPMCKFTASANKIEFFETDADHVDSMAVIVSRNSDNGIKVSDSYLHLNDIAATIESDSKATQFRREALDSWGATGESILQGSISSDDAEPATTKVKLTLSSNDESLGTVDPAGTTKYDAGTSVTIKAIAGADAYLEQWSDGNTSATRTIVLNEDTTLEAIFQEREV